MNNQRLSLPRLIGLAMGLFSVQTFWGFTWATLPLYLKDLADSNIVTGIMISTTGITGAALPILAGSISDRISTPWGRRKPLIAAGWLLACAMLLVMPGIGSLQAALPVIIAAYAGFFVAIGPYFSLLPDTVPVEQRSTASGIMFLVGGTGMLSYLLFAARLWDSSHMRPFLWAVGAIIVSMAVMFFAVKERSAGNGQRQGSGLIREAFGNRNTARFFSGMTLWWIGLWMVSAFFVIACKELFRVSTEKAVHGFFIFNVAFVLFALPAGLLASRLGLKKVTGFALAALAVGLASIPFLKSFYYALPFMILTGASYGAVIAVSYPFFLKLVPEGKTAGYVGLYMACQNGTLLFGPAIGGIVLDKLGYIGLFSGASVFILAGLGIFLTVRTPAVSE